MKNLSKLLLPILAFFVIACGNSAATENKQTETVQATTPTEVKTEEPMTTETAMEDVSEETTPSVEKEMNEPENAKEQVASSQVASTINTTVQKKEEATPAQPQKVNVKAEVKEMGEKLHSKAKEAVETVKEKAIPPTTVKEVKEEITKTASEMPTSPTTNINKTPEPPKPAPFSHEAWDKLAQKHISATGKVNYKGFKADKAAFDAYLQSLADNPIQSSWSRSKKMAYWINAYNAFTIKLIVDNYPIKSIMDLDGGKPWDRKWIKLGGKTYSLNNIEHDILRPQYKDARIHFAVNCAAKSCPPVWNRAWTASNLNSQLERATKTFINNSKYNSVSAGSATISKIFEWYAVDFGEIVAYINKYANTKVNSGATVNYKEYDWALNE